MSTKTPEPRNRTRLPKGKTGPEFVAPAAKGEPDIVKLRAVLTMSAEGRTQREIAKHFGKDERTIRRWTAEARRRQVTNLRSYDAEKELAKALYHLDDEFAVAMRIRRIAEETVDFKLALKANEQCQRITETRLAILTKFGLFDGYRLDATSVDDPHTAGAALIAGAARAVLLGENDNATNGAARADEEVPDEFI